MSKRAKVSLVTALGAVVIVIGLGAWGVATGRITSFAGQYFFPGYTGGVINGKITCTSPCAVAGTKVYIYDVAQGGTNPDRWADVGSDGSYAILNVPYSKAGITYDLYAMRDCPPISGELGYCAGEGPIVTMTSADHKKTANISINPGGGALVVIVRKLLTPSSGPRPSNCILYEGKWACTVSGAIVDFQQGDFKSESTTNSAGIVKTQYYDSEYNGTVTIRASKNDLTGEGQANIIGCSKVEKTIFIR